jgi:hypothetical protein
VLLGFAPSEGPHQWHEDRGYEGGERLQYGHREASPMPGNAYFPTGVFPTLDPQSWIDRADQTNGCYYLGVDNPQVPTVEDGWYEFRLVIEDTCQKNLLL